MTTSRPYHVFGDARPTPSVPAADVTVGSNAEVQNAGRFPMTSGRCLRDDRDRSHTQIRRKKCQPFG